MSSDQGVDLQQCCLNEQGEGDGHQGCNCMDATVIGFPPGYRFEPFDEELLLNYLKKKVDGHRIPFQDFMSHKIREVELYASNPEDLTADLKLEYGEKDWYFFTPRDKKYPNGNRPNRAAGDGYWKATGADKKIYVEGNVIGSRKALVYYRGKPPKGEKTNWIMHEYMLPPTKKSKVKNIIGNKSMRLNQWVLCKIYKKADKVQREGAQQVQQLLVEDDSKTSAPPPTNIALMSNEPQRFPSFQPDPSYINHSRGAQQVQQLLVVEDSKTSAPPPTNVALMSNEPQRFPSFQPHPSYINHSRGAQQVQQLLVVEDSKTSAPPPTNVALMSNEPQRFPSFQPDPSYINHSRGGNLEDVVFPNQPIPSFNNNFVDSNTFEYIMPDMFDQYEYDYLDSGLGIEDSLFI